MKKIIVAVILVAGITAVAFASFSTTNKKKTGTEKKMEKKECTRKCMFS
jgi:hypothetical protein